MEWVEQDSGVLRSDLRYIAALFLVLSGVLWELGQFQGRVPTVWSLRHLSMTKLKGAA